MVHKYLCLFLSIVILGNLRTIYYGNDDVEMSFNPYKAVLAVKSLNNVSNQKPYDPHAFKEELKTKFQATLALTNCFPNSMVFMEHLLSENVDEDGEAVPLTMQNYFEMDDIEKD